METVQTKDFTPWVGLDPPPRCPQPVPGEFSDKFLPGQRGVVRDIFLHPDIIEEVSSKSGDVVVACLIPSFGEMLSKKSA